ncbi:MAG TPA: DUF5615 family PIN-like protein [Pirellulales bacterium]|nr:DUF5615 family PIN-like protein [Pirellulales bacterium]
MKVLANENFPRVAVETLRSAGHDVIWARTDMPGAADDVILQRSEVEGRLVVTFDKDFGELAFRWGLPAACGVALFRLRTQDPDYVAARVLDAFAEAAGWVGHFAVVEDARVRVRPLP